MSGTAARRAYGVGAAAFLVMAVALSASAEPPEKVTVCHATGSSVHPFVEIHPSVNGAWAHYDHHADDAVAEFTYKGQTYSRLSTDTIEINASGSCTLVRAPDEEEPPEVEPGPPVVNEPPFTG